jgi:hypothetical protein
VFTPFHKPPYTYPYGRFVDETTTKPDDDFTDERVAELYGSFLPHARDTSLANGVCDPAVVDVALVLLILLELQTV